MDINRRVFFDSMPYMVPTSRLPFEFKSPLKLVVFKSGASFFDAEQMTLLYDIADIMIPTTSTPIASYSYTAQMLDMLMFASASPSTQAQIKVFLSQFKAKARSRKNKTYLSMPLDERVAFLVDIDRSAFDKSKTDFLVAYKRLKELIFTIHYSS